VEEAGEEDSELDSDEDLDQVSWKGKREGIEEEEGLMVLFV
jgi:hypothetical protein